MSKKKQVKKKKISPVNILAIGFIISFLIAGVLVILDYTLWGICLSASAVIITIAVALLSSDKSK